MADETTINPTDALHPAVRELLEHFECGHLPAHLYQVSVLYYNLAHTVAYQGEGAEVTVGLRKLLEAKDCAVRAARVKHERLAREKAAAEAGP